MSDGGTIALVERAPTPGEYGRLRASVGWNEVDPDAIVAGLSRSLYAVVLEPDGDAAGVPAWDSLSIALGICGEPWPCWA
jgi:hypothetical protein